MVGDLTLGTMIGAVINFVLLLVLLRLVAYNPIRQVLANRRKRISDSLKQLEVDLQEAEEFRNEMDRNLSAAKAEAQSVIDRAERAAAAEEAAILNRAREEAARLLTVAREEIDGEKRRALREIQQEVADISVRMAEKLMRTSLDKDAGHRLIQDFIAREGVQ